MIRFAQVRVPAHANLDRIVIVNGRRVRLGDALAAINPNETRRLKSGRTVSFQEVVDSLDDWEKQSGRRLSKMMVRLPLDQKVRGKMETTAKQLDSDLVARRAASAKRWDGAATRPATTTRSFSVFGTTTPDNQALVQPPPGTPDPTMARPLSEPTDGVWARRWGDDETFGAFVTSSYGNEFRYGAKNEAVSGCVAVFQVGASVFGRSLELARVYAGAAATRQGFVGSSRLYLGGGNAAPLWKKEGALKLQESYPIKSGNVDVPLFSWGPIELRAAMGADAMATVGWDVAPMAVPNGFGCRVTLAPGVSAKARGGVRAVPLDAIRGLVKVILGDIEVGARVNLTIIESQLPMSLGLGVVAGPAGPFDHLLDTADVRLDTTLLRGNVTAYADVDLNWFWSLVAEVFGIDGDLHWEETLFEWPGKTTAFPIASVVNSEIKVGRK